MKENGTESTESPLKKRRKATSVSTPAAPINTDDVYKSVCALEEAETANRDPEKDLKIFHDTCTAFQTYMEEIAALKKKGTPEARTAVNEKRVEACLLFVMLKKLNRLEKLRTKQSREELYKVKSQVDSQHLQLQNLLYEVLHLQKEVTKCLQFKSQDEEIDLVPLEEFKRDSKESVQNLDAHQLQKARLEWELQQRRQLSELCKQLQGDKEKIAQDIEKQQHHLDNLAPMLRSILQVTKPVEESLGVSVEETRHQHQVAYLLPQPLFFLYVQADAQHQASDPLLSVSISGDEEEARRLKQNLNDSKEDDESDSDQEQENAETNKRHHRKRGIKVDRQEERRKRLLLKHPLTVDITVSLKDGSKVMLIFSYMVNLQIITVKSVVNLANPISGLFASQLMTPEFILSSLFPGDTGLESPNVANHYQLLSVGVGPFPELVAQLGNPYVWAQRVAGLDFINCQTDKTDSSKSIKASSELSQASIPGVIQAVRQRVKARLALCRQVQSLETGTITPIPSLQSQFPTKLSSNVSEFQQITWSDYRLEKCIQLLTSAQQVSEHDFLYKMTMSRGGARLIAFVAIKCNYPVSPPMFSLQLNWNGQHTSADSDAIRDMEREVNVYYKELMVGPGWANVLLAAQVTRLLCCFDVYLESNGENDEKKSFSRDKVFLQPFRGRTRARPYKYLQLGGGIFTQR